MRLTVLLAMTAMLSCGLPASPAWAQKGMGEQAGVARQTEKPKVVSRSGSVLKVEIGPCKKTMGRSDQGAHFLLRTEKGRTLNIHLGPATAVKHITEKLTVGTKVTVDVFRTEKMPSNHFVAKTITVDESTIQLRDQGLRPTWAAGNGHSRGRGVGQGPSWRKWTGNGYKRGYGQGRGRGWRWR